MPGQILFVDDEPYYAEHLVDALQKAGYKVVLQEDVRGALDYLTTAGGDLGLVVLDYMMPTPAGVPSAATLDGLATGRWFLRAAWPLLVAHGVPVLVLTNRNIESVAA